MIRSSEVSGEQLWLLDEGHCFRDQLMRFCQLESAQSCQIAYRLGSMETFMRMVESGKGITFIPELAVLQLNDEQKSTGASVCHATSHTENLHSDTYRLHSSYPAQYADRKIQSLHT